MTTRNGSDPAVGGSGGAGTDAAAASDRAGVALRSALPTTATTTTGSGADATTAGEATTFAAKSTKIVSAVSSYWLVSISMVFVNKALLSSPRTKIDAPLFVTWYQCLCTVGACYALGELGWGGVPRFELRRDVSLRVLPLSAVFVAMIGFNNLCLKYVEVTFYQVARSLTIVFNVVFDFLLLGQRTSKQAIACIAIVVVGFVLGNAQELRWSLAGVVFGVLSSFFVALNSIFVKRHLPHVDNSPWRMTLYNNANATVLFLPLIIAFGELPTIASSENVRSLHFWAVMTVGGTLGVAISFASAAQIKWTSPLTHNLSATAKAAAQAMLALIVFRNPITPLGFLSVLIVLAGSLGYTLVRRAEMRTKHDAETQRKGPASGAASPKRSGGGAGGEGGSGGGRDTAIGVGAHGARAEARRA